MTTTNSENTTVAAARNTSQATYSSVQNTPRLKSSSSSSSSLPCGVNGLSSTFMGIVASFPARFPALARAAGAGFARVTVPDRVRRV